ncbi:hypothetical protein Halhy_0567 [Haliscomenobacter hydrossis DSM 1100]|uniref:eCIS core domain-containing protein n=1 Tax=Haliscomenobacter hydrossis (strain ATCC 27775 / DSM 1100 / LMG 10767 / O) TaxID=760192 RepID=F4L0G4_HALH1|nr:hypothetical protein Halhy_0567 [Haliscomenobacter hydrossis DSM 1100]
MGKPGDHHEREADSMAEKVVRGSEATPAVQNKCADCDAKDKTQRKPLADNITPFIQRMAEKEEPVQKAADKEEPVQKAEDKQEEPVQKMEDKKEEPVQKAADKEEPVQKAEDKQEEPVQKMEDKKEEPVQKAADKEEPVQKCEREEEEPVPKTEDKKEEPVQKAADKEEPVQKAEDKQEEPVQKMEDKKEEPVQKAADKEEPVQKAEEKEEAAQTKTATGATPTASRSVESGLNSSKGNGSPLPESTRSTMEGGFGVDFSGVRIHTDSQATAMNRDLHAQAFTHGNDIYFNEGKYNPATTEGKTLLAHELTHTVQQGASVQRKEVLTPPPAQPLQMNEEEVDLAKELEAADQDQKKAIDPSIAEKAKEKVEQGKVAAEEKSAKKKAAKKKGGKGKGSGKRAAGKSSSRKRGKKGAAEAAEAALKKSLGAVGKDLSDASSFACAKADEKATDLAENEQTHDDAGEKQQQTDAAVVAPPEEGQAMSNNEQVAGLDAKPEPSTDKEAAKSTLNNALVSAMPTNIKEVNNFESQGKAKVVGSQVLGEVNKDVGAVKDTYNDIEQPLPAKPTPESTELPPEEAAPGTPMLDLGKGAVPPLKPEHTEVVEFDTKSDELLQKEGITQDQLDMVDSGELAEANKERKSLKKKVAEEPAKIQQFGEQASQKVEKDLKQEEAQGKSQMRAKRKRGLNETKANQTKTKSALEKKREEVTKHINGIFDAAKSSVTTKLANLEKQNLRAFDAGQLRASVDFEKEVKRDINAFKKRRYSGLFGGARWIKDYFAGIDDFPEVQNALSSGRERYIQKIDKLIADIDKANQKVIAECKLELANARKQIETYVKTLGPALRATGQKAMKEMKGKLAEMDKFIDQQRDKLREKLCSKREEAIKAIDKKIEKMKEEMSGLLSKLGNLILNAMIKFFEWALEKAGYSPEKIMGIINKGKAVIKKIVTDPIGFFKNIGKAVGQGVENFKNNIQQHLIKGMMGWLTGAMGDAGLQLPAQWDLKGVIFLLLQIMNLTKDALMKKLGEKIGQPMLQFAMTSVGIVKRVVAEGPMALWDMIKEKAEEIKEQVMEGIRNWIATEMVKQGIIKLVSMLNPVGAIVQAIIAIYNTVMFFVENWQRIVDFVSSVFNAIVDIAMGRLGPAIAAVERAMGQTIPIILGFIARLLNLSGIGKAIRKTIEKIRKPIDTIVDKMLNGVAKLVKPLVAKAKGLVNKGKDAAGKVLDWLGIKKRFRNQAGESHSIYFKGGEKNPQLTIASAPKTVLAYLNEQEIASKGDDVKLEIIRKAKESNQEIGRLLRANQKDKPKIEAEILKLASYFEKLGGVDPEILTKSKGELQSAASSANSELSSDLRGAGGRILSDREYSAASNAEEPWLGPVFYGTAVERLAAEQLISNSNFKKVGGPNQPDFIGKGKYEGLIFDITTIGAIPAHLVRSYGKKLIFANYARPSGFRIFPPKSKKK